MALTIQTLTAQTFPVKEGRLVFHRYTDWSAYDGALYIYNFSTKTLDYISMSWNIVHTANAHFSPDGSKIVFMGIPKDQFVSKTDPNNRSKWDIFLWTVGDTAQPTNLTAGNGVLDQDPKFFSDNKRVAFKQNGDVAIVDITTKAVTKLTTGGTVSERSMEYPTMDGKEIMFEENSIIYRINIATKDIVPVYTVPNVQSYYPIVRDDSTFYFSRWFSPSGHGDEIYLGKIYDIDSAVPVAFDTEAADESDACPVDSTLVFFSSTRSGTKGGYDLYLGDIKSGLYWSLTYYGVNSSIHELGASYTKFSYPTKVGALIETPKIFFLSQNFPNPFNPSTTIRYSLPRSSHVMMKVYDVYGREISTLINKVQETGEHSVDLNLTNVSSGVFFYQLAVGNQTLTKKCVLLK
ncbi:MAG: T9SS type A sorting domain-containing protein [Bacteroidota bacterium]|nr:T9SS type A sorting domain-containing protein [Bacteroidota bacterium]